MKEFEVPSGSYAVHKKIIDLGFPKSILVSMIKRSDGYLVPVDSTIIETNDTLIVLSEAEDEFKKVKECLETPVIYR